MSGFSNAIAQHETYKEILSTSRAGRFPFGVLGTTGMHKVFLLHSLLSSLNETAGNGAPWCSCRTKAPPPA